MDPVNLIERFYGAQYNGTNGTALAALLDADVTSDNGSTLVLDVPGYGTLTLNATKWVVWKVLDGVATIAQENLTDTDRAGRYGEAPADAVLVAAVGESDPIEGGGIGGQVQVIDVAMWPALPDDGYVPIAALRGEASLLSGHGITAVEVLDEETVRVTVDSAALAPAGATVYVVAHALTAG